MSVLFFITYVGIWMLGLFFAVGLGHSMTLRRVKRPLEDQATQAKARKYKRAR